MNIGEEWWSELETELVEDSSRIWAKKTFVPVAGVWIANKNGGRILAKLSEHEHLPSDGVIDNNAWDHEHCALCFEKIAAYEDCQHEGYTDGDKWLCIECYNRYILPRSIQ